ncbi:MAG: hypothetical protein LBL99_01330 [Holosporaceae bacterium]|jgi:hypothetical protein|nr:hypothetical protein [Holosporaceae bacterium]
MKKKLIIFCALGLTLLTSYSTATKNAPLSEPLRVDQKQRKIIQNMANTLIKDSANADQFKPWTTMDYNLRLRVFARTLAHRAFTIDRDSGQYEIALSYLVAKAIEENDIDNMLRIVELVTVALGTFDQDAHNLHKGCCDYCDYSDEQPERNPYAALIENIGYYGHNKIAHATIEDRLTATREEFTKKYGADTCDTAAEGIPTSQVSVAPAIWPPSATPSEMWQRANKILAEHTADDLSQ